MRHLFVVATAFFAVLALLCLVKVATEVPDRAQIVRWCCAGVGFAFIAVFWVVVRRRYTVTGSLRAEPVTAALGAAGLAVLVVVGVVFRLTA